MISFSQLFTLNLKIKILQFKKNTKLNKIYSKGGFLISKTQIAKWFLNY